MISKNELKIFFNLISSIARNRSVVARLRMQGYEEDDIDKDVTLCADSLSGEDVVPFVDSLSPDELVIYARCKEEIKRCDVKEFKWFYVISGDVLYYDVEHPCHTLAEEFRKLVEERIPKDYNLTPIYNKFTEIFDITRVGMLFGYNDKVIYLDDTEAACSLRTFVINNYKKLAKVINRVAPYEVIDIVRVYDDDLGIEYISSLGNCRILIPYDDRVKYLYDWIKNMLVANKTLPMLTTEEFANFTYEDYVHWNNLVFGCMFGVDFHRKITLYDSYNCAFKPM